ncbi:condensation domain-containing protein [Streptomyces sp. NBC_01794]|uniref:condensation domain-containing protein n=1 Tax=Streptomyces sp. NBC_01794 TaxID=2975942 RepID=UPI00308BA8ED|nr:condensation domain-containing protein [Streptomyces sp. NBC_01794]
MTANCSSDVAMTVVVDPGQPPYDTPPVLELRGPVDPARIEAAFDRAAAHQGEGMAWQHRLLRHGPDHHTLHLSTEAEGVPAGFPAGLLADLLTLALVTTSPLAPAQYAALRAARTGTRPRYTSAVLEARGPLDPVALRHALYAVVAAHPLLSARLDSRSGGRMTCHPTPRAAHELLWEEEFTDEAGVRRAVAAAGRSLDPSAGRTVQAVLARDRRPAGPYADRLVLVVHELVVDDISWRILLEDLEAALDAIDAGAPPGLPPEAVPFEEWIARLRRGAADPGEAVRWRETADARASAQAFVASLPVPDTAPLHHPGFTLDAAATARLTGPLPRRYGLNVQQVLTGAVGLALARWRGHQDVAFDLRTDGRQGSHDLARTVGPFASAHPVLLDADRTRPADGYLTQAAPALAETGGTAFVACSEYTPDPVLRLVLRELVPTLVSFTPHGPDELPPATSRFRATAEHRPARHTTARSTVDIHSRVMDGMLRISVDWVPCAVDGVTEDSVQALTVLLRDVLEELAGSEHHSPSVRSLAPSPLQRELFTDAAAHPGTGRHVEQLAWTWYGPLDTSCFTAAWQSVFDRDTALRVAFEDGPELRLVLHDQVSPEVVRLPHGAAEWRELVARDRLRGFDLRRPGPLRATLLDGDPDQAAAGSFTRVLLTYHHALLDGWSVRLLLQQFYRAYLAGGTLPGGDRRPDIRDYTDWLRAQDTAAAKEFWTRAAPRAGAATSPVPAASAPPAGPAGRLTSWAGASAVRAGTGRIRLRLTPDEAARLSTWAGGWGVTESSALQAVWALLLYRATGAAGPVPIRFSVAVSGRGIALEGVDRMPGTLRNPLPMSAEVDPESTVPRLLAALRDQALDKAAYEWVSAGQIRAWTGRPDGADSLGAAEVHPDDTLLVFASRQQQDGLAQELAARGIRVGFPETTGTSTAHPLTLVAHHDSAGGLVLTATHDLARCADATGVLNDGARLLRELPHIADESRTIADVLRTLPPPRAPDDTTEPAFITLRAAERPGASTVCLVPAPGTPRSCYDQLARLYTGPGALLLLSPAPEGAKAHLAALRPLLDAGERLVLGGFSGGGVIAYGIAQLIAADGGRPPLTVLSTATTGPGTAAADGEESVRALARMLEEAAERA